MRGARPFGQWANDLTMDHPRRCGEHMIEVGSGVRDRGSSPQMRGALFWTGEGTREDGIIPADAGSTGFFAVLKCWCADHPRRCGEHIFHRLLLFFVAGSSPQMRGAHDQACADRQCPRIIPADAGSTTNRFPQHQDHGDHPRRCGEHFLPLGFRDAGCLDHPRRCGEHYGSGGPNGKNSGSSPQMRGAPDGDPQGEDAGRIIPADAGSTDQQSFRKI